MIAIKEVEFMWIPRGVMSLDISLEVRFLGLSNLGDSWKLLDILR